MSGTGTSLVGSGFRPIPQDAAPAAWSLGRVGLWTPKSGPSVGHPLWRLPDGTDFDIIASSGLPPQAGHGGQFLTTDGSTASWVSLPSFPEITLEGDVFGIGTTDILTTVNAISGVPVVDMQFGTPPANHQALVYNSAVGHQQFEPTNIVYQIVSGSGILANGQSGGAATGSVSVAIDTTASLTWTGLHNFNNTTTFGLNKLRLASGGGFTILASNSTVSSRTWTFPDTTDTAVGQTRAVNTTAGDLTGGGDLSADRTLGLATTAVTPSSYGDASHVATFTVDGKGRLTAAGSSAVAISDAAVTFAARAANTVFAGPTSGGNATPTWRALVAADIPSLSGTYLPLAGGTMAGAITFSGTQLGTYTLGGTPTIGGTPTLGASLTISGGVNMTASSGAGAFDFSAATGLFKTSTGANTLSGLVTIAPGAASSGTPTALTLTLPANTGLTTTAEVTAVNINLAANAQTWAAGTIPNQRFVRIQAPTIAFASASTATVATTFEVGGAPVQGTNATITTALALRVAAGASRFDGNVSINAMPAQAYNLAVTGTNSGNDLVFLENNDNTKYTSIAFADSAGTAQIAMGWANSTVADTVVRSTFQIFTGSNDFNINRGSSNISMTVKGTGKIGVNNQSPGAYLDVKSGDADSGTAKAMIINTSTAWSTNAAQLLQLSTNGVQKGAFQNFVGGGGWSFLVLSGAGYYETSGNTGVRLVGSSQLDLWTAGSAKVTMTTAALSSTADFGMTLGTSSLRYAEAWSRRYLGVEQTIAAAATFTIDPALGDMVRVTLNATAINAGGITAGTFKPGEQIVIEFIQDATGGRTLTQANFSSTFVFAGGTYTVTAGANKRDIFVGIWDNTSAKLYMSPLGVNF